MRPCEEVIVTVIISEPATSYDMELPAFLSIGEIKKKLLETLRLMDIQKYGAVGDIDLTCGGQLLRESATLAGYGIWDGSIVKIKTERAR